MRQLSDSSRRAVLALSATMLPSLSRAQARAASGENLAKDNIFVNVLDFGARGDGLYDNTDHFAAAIKYAVSSNIGTILIPDGDFALRSIQLESGVSLKGCGIRSTVLSALPSSETGFISIADGPIRDIVISELTLSGGRVQPTNPGQWAMLCQAKPKGAKQNGGFWLSAMRDIWINGFNNGIYLQGGNNYLLPHQWLHLELVTINTLNNGTAFRADGQVEHVSCVSCTFDGSGPTGGVGTKLCRSPTGKLAPRQVTFLNSTHQNSELAVSIDAASSIAFFGCWFERNGSSIKINDFAANINVINSNFADAGMLPDGGSCISNGVGSGVNIIGCEFYGKYQTAIKNDEQSRGITGGGCSFQNEMSSSFVGMLPTMKVKAGILRVYNYSTVRVLGPEMIHTIESELFPGTLLTIIKTGNVGILSTGNIDVAGLELSINKNNILKLVYDDHEKKWVLA